MEWLVPVNDMLQDEITRITHTLLPPGYVGDSRSIRVMQDSLGREIDALGMKSAVAQGLNKVITTAEKLHNSPTHALYLLKDPAGKGGKGELIALLKVGRKHLFLFDERQAVREVEPLCVLDFYVRGDRQRLGYGKKLFDHMLKEEAAKVEHLAVDGPSPKIEQFLFKYYGIEKLLRQSNNFAISPRFFTSGDHSVSGRNTPTAAAGVGRYSAHKPQSAIGSVIHGAASQTYYQDGSRGSSRASTPEMTAELKASTIYEPEFSAAHKSHVPEPAVERPTTLQMAIITSGGGDGSQKASLAPSPNSAAAGASLSRRDSQLTDRGFFDVKFHHNKLW